MKLKEKMERWGRKIERVLGATGSTWRPRKKKGRRETEILAFKLNTSRESLGRDSSTGVRFAPC